MTLLRHFQYIESRVPCPHLYDCRSARHKGPSKKSSCGNLMELNDEARHQSSLRFRPNAFGRRAEHLLRNIAAAADGGGSVGSVPILRDGPRQIAWVTLSESLGY